MKKHILWFLLYVIAALLASCTTSKTLHHTGSYTVKERSGDTTTFKEVRGKYLVFSDTLKKDDVIRINVVRLFVK